jgi:hypothetical protein
MSSKSRTADELPVSLAEIRLRADICDVWSALGGGPLRHSRGQAFWRNGDGYSVSLNADRGLWHDFVSGDGGDVIALVRLVRGCGFRDAVAWLASFTGVSLADGRRQQYEADPAWSDDLCAARYWGHAIEILAEWSLESLPTADSERFNLTQLLSCIRSTDASLVDEYRSWRKRNAGVSAATVAAAQHSESRLADWFLEKVPQ